MPIHPALSGGLLLFLSSPSPPPSPALSCMVPTPTWAARKEHERRLTNAKKTGGLWPPLFL